ncbi:BQ5605_C004g03079 [Microbotryum silenes-dioicae]|uniref:beta-glucosidase n=1 Tax=Microbotryum silenes-dioicae TaxID=796604 RepID=A0A2X0MD09_9BASI|nr:BQ5605_C004g03079 [Microbotryum silenes-dioicae]
MARNYTQLDVDTTLAKLSVTEKTNLLAGKDFWHLNEVQRHGIPSVRVSDGPNGVRGTKFFNGVKANCFPCSTGLGASFDKPLAKKVGAALGHEAHAKGAHVLLGPTCNMQRSPLGGRGFESFAEDPHLSGMLTANYVEGVQSTGVAACVKHFVANDQEVCSLLFNATPKRCTHVLGEYITQFERFSSDSVVGARALREIYLEPFRLAVKHAHPLTFMSSYNRINGIHVSESKDLLDDILRKEWGFDGLVMSDWTGTYSTDAAVKAGLDLEMPGPTTMRGAAIGRMLAAGKLTVSDIDARVRNVLELVNHAIASGIPFNGSESLIDTPESRALLREAANSAHVLLKNSDSLLPLKHAKKIAVIGANAKVPVASGGGSASLASTYTVSPLEGITSAAKEIGAKVEFANGCSTFRYLPLLDPLMKNGKLEAWKDDFLDDWYQSKFDDAKAPEPDYQCNIDTSMGILVDDRSVYAKLGATPRTRISCTYTPETSGPYLIDLCTLGFGSVLIDGLVVLDNVKTRKSGEIFFGGGSEEESATIQLEKGREYLIELRHSNNLTSAEAGPFSAMPQAIGFRLGLYPDQPEEVARQEAVELAKASDVAIVVVGTNKDWESEGFDRKTIALPGAQDALVQAVQAANPKTIIVTQSGCPVSMPWIEQASTVLQAFFGGNELGNALADIVFGKVNPSGKSPVQEAEQQAFDWNSQGQTGGQPFVRFVRDYFVYARGSALHRTSIASSPPPPQGIYMGYRHYDANNIVTLFPFGFGLSYTTFSLSSLSRTPLSSQAECTFSMKVRNTGSVPGRSVVQVYVRAVGGARGVDRPKKELIGFTKTSLLQPGEEEVVKVEVTKEAFSYWDEKKGSWSVEEGEYEFLVGENSGELKLGEKVEVKEAFDWRGL